MFEISLENKICLITGASQGIGRAIALTLAMTGLKGITIIGRNRDEKSYSVEKELQDYGTDTEYIVGDASKEETIHKAVDRTIKRWGKIDILINNAGIACMTDFDTTSAEQWDRVMDVNLKSVFLTMKACAGIMKKQGGGSIVNISSISGITGGATGPDYGASKGGIIALTKYAARLLGPDQIRVNVVAPGTIATDMIRRNYSKLSPEETERKLSAIPMGRMGEPEEVGKAVLFLVSDMSSYVSGEVLGVTGARMS